MIVYYHYGFIPPTPPTPPTASGIVGTKVKFYTWAQLGTVALVSTSSTESVEAGLTDGGRNLLARMLAEGVAFKLIEFGIGTDGISPSDPADALPVNPSASALGNEILRNPIGLLNRLPGGDLEVYCRVDSADANGYAVGEIGLYAEIVRSPLVPAEVGTKVLFAIAHEPMAAKTQYHAFTKKLTVQL